MYLFSLELITNLDVWTIIEPLLNQERPTGSLERKHDDLRLRLSVGAGWERIGE